MTAATEVLYVRDGSRFVVYDERAQHVPPIPVPLSLADPEEEPEGVEDPERPGRTILAAPKCPHGHFRRWADAVDPRTRRPNCKHCHPRR